MARELRVQIVGDPTSYQRALGDAGRSTSKFAGHLGRAAKVAGLAIGGAALGGIAVTLRQGVKEWTEHAKVAAQTSSVLKSTGGVAGVTAKHVEDLAGSIMRKTGIDDEQIQTTENLLLGYTNLRNELGKGNDVFDRATKLVTDYSVRTGKSATQAVNVFGKALSDVAEGKIPTTIRGIGKLNDGLVEHMKELVASGHSTQAQALLLDELEKRYGGAAEAAGKTLPGQLNILKESFSNLSGEIVAGLVPSLQKAVTWLTEHWDQIAATIKAVFDGIGWAFTNVLKPTFEALVVAGEAVVAWVRDNWPEISRVTMEVFNNVQAIVTTAAAIITDLWNRFGSTIVAQTKAAWEFIKAEFEGALNVIRGIVNVIGGLLQGDWSRVWEGIKQIFSGAIQGLIAQVRFGFDTILNIVRAGGQAMLLALEAAWNAITKLASAVFNGIAGIIKGAIAAAVSAAEALGEGIKDAVLGVVKAIPRELLAVFALIPGIILGIAPAVARAAGQLADGIIGPIKSAISWVRSLIDAFKSLADAISGGGTQHLAPGGPPTGEPMAAGGSVRRGIAHLVGERGPELFVPGRSGTIIPNHMLGGAGAVVVNVSMPNYLGTPEDVAAAVRREFARLDRRNQ